jgi:hypothetical protein
VQQSESPETVDLSRRERLALVGPASKRYQDFHSVPLVPLTRLKSLQGGADTPLAYKILCVRFTCVVHDGFSVPTKASLSATGVTLDTGRWLALTRPGLAPGKKRQASLGAPTLRHRRVVGRAFRKGTASPPGLTAASFSVFSRLRRRLGRRVFPVPADLTAFPAGLASSAWSARGELLAKTVDHGRS